MWSSYCIHKGANETLDDYLAQKVFNGEKGSQMQPQPQDVEGFEVFIKRYTQGLAIERAAVDSLI